MRLVLDTNTALSGLIWGVVPGQLIDAAAAGKALLITSVPLLDELRGVLFRDKFAGQLAERDKTARDLFEGYASLTRLVFPADIAPVVLADPDDDVVLATAVAGLWFVSPGDRERAGRSVACQARIVPVLFRDRVTGRTRVARWHFK